jgi:hypothetical protein
MRQFFGYVDQDDTAAASGGVQPTTTAKPRAVTVQGDTEIYFTGKTTLSNGISVSMRVELEGNTSNDMIDESFATIEGAFGQIYLGSTDNVAAKMLITAPTPMVGLSNGNIYGNHGLNAGLKNGGSTSVTPCMACAIQMNDDDAEKISYVTPRFAGFQAGISYTPELTQDHTGAGYARYDSRTNYRGGWTVGGNFTRAFGAFDVAVGGGYTSLRKSVNDSTNPTTVTAPDPEGYGLGAQIGYAGFRLGGGFVKVEDQLAAVGVTANQAGAAIAVTGYQDNWNHGTVYELGLTYTFGPVVVGANYTNGKAKDTSALAGDSKYEAFSAGARYTLGPGVDVQAGLFHYKMKGEGTSLVAGKDVDNTKATAIVTGLSLSF